MNGFSGTNNYSQGDSSYADDLNYQNFNPNFFTSYDPYFRNNQYYPENNFNSYYWQNSSAKFNNKNLYKKKYKQFPNNKTPAAPSYLNQKKFHENPHVKYDEKCNKDLQDQMLKDMMKDSDINSKTEKLKETLNKLKTKSLKSDKEKSIIKESFANKKKSSNIKLTEKSLNTIGKDAAPSGNSMAKKRIAHTKSKLVNLKKQKVNIGSEKQTPSGICFKSQKKKLHPLKKKKAKMSNDNLNKLKNTIKNLDKCSLEDLVERPYSSRGKHLITELVKNHRQAITLRLNELRFNSANFVSSGVNCLVSEPLDTADIPLDWFHSISEIIKKEADEILWMPGASGTTLPALLANTGSSEMDLIAKELFNGEGLMNSADNATLPKDSEINPYNDKLSNHEKATNLMSNDDTLRNCNQNLFNNVNSTNTTNLDDFSVNFEKNAWDNTSRNCNRRGNHIDGTTALRDSETTMCFPEASATIPRTHDESCSSFTNSFLSETTNEAPKITLKVRNEFKDKLTDNVNVMNSPQPSEISNNWTNGSTFDQTSRLYCDMPLRDPMSKSKEVLQPEYRFDSHFTSKSTSQCEKESPTKTSDEDRLPVNTAKKKLSAIEQKSGGHEIDIKMLQTISAQEEELIKELKEAEVKLTNIRNQLQFLNELRNQMLEKHS